LWSADALAQDDAKLIELLRDGSSFRVRARAALALGRGGEQGETSEHTISALEQALADSHAAVRAAAAAALGWVGTRRSVGALRTACRDSYADVVSQAKNALRMIAAREVIARAATEPANSDERARPSIADIRYAVVLGEMRNRTGLPGNDIGALLSERIGHELRKLDNVAVFTLAEMDEAVARELDRHRVAVFRVEGNLSRVDSAIENGENKVRCEVQLLLMDEPERTLRSMWKGAATATEQPRGPRDLQVGVLARKTLKSAVHSATASAAEAIAAAAVHRDLSTGDIRAEASAAHVK
jgi:HEAT repeat protein